MKEVVRIFLKRGKERRKYVLFNPPFPPVGAIVTMPDGTTWQVAKTEKDKGFLIKMKGARPRMSQRRAQP